MKTSNFLALFVSLASYVLANPTPCKNGESTFSPTFDQLPINQPPRDGLAQLHYNGFTVLSNTTFCDNRPGGGFCIPPTPHGGHNYLGANDANTAYISNANPNSVAFSLESFWFACTASGSGGTAPAACTLQVVYKIFTLQREIVTKTFDYTGDAQNPGMVKVDLSGSGGQDYYFSVINGAGSTGLVLDSFKVVQSCQASD